MAGCSRFQFKPRGLAYFSVNVACKGLDGFVIPSRFILLGRNPELEHGLQGSMSAIYVFPSSYCGMLNVSVIPSKSLWYCTRITNSWHGTCAYTF